MKVMNHAYCEQRQAPFAKAWFRYLRECKSKGIKMSQTVAARRMGMKRSTFSTAINRGPSDAVLFRFSLLTGIAPETIDPSLEGISLIPARASGE